jgi:Zn-dependent protease
MLQAPRSRAEPVRVGALAITGRIGPIAVRAGPASLLGAVALAVVTHGLAQRVAPDADAVGISVLVVLLVQACVLAHELGHAGVAVAQGGRGVQVHLGLLGGAAGSWGAAPDARSAFRLVLAGPAVTAVAIAALVLACLSAGWTWTDVSRDLLAQRPHGTVAFVLWVVLLTQLAMLMINLVPVLPLDGGGILAALWWRLTGDRLGGHRLLAWLGCLAGAAAIAVGLSMGGGDRFTALTLLTLGWALVTGATHDLRAEPVRARMSGLTLMDAAHPGFVTADAEVPAGRAWVEVFVPLDPIPFVPVVLGGRYIGAAHRDAVREAAGEAPATPMRSLAVPPPADDLVDREHRDTALERVLASPALRRGGGVVAVDDDGVYLGVGRWPQIQSALVGEER